MACIVQIMKVEAQSALSASYFKIVHHTNKSKPMCLMLGKGKDI